MVTGPPKSAVDVPHLVLLMGGGGKAVLREESCKEWVEPDVEFHTQLIVKCLQKIKLGEAPASPLQNLYSFSFRRGEMTSDKCQRWLSHDLSHLNSIPAISSGTELASPSWWWEGEPARCSCQGKHNTCKMIPAAALLWMYCFFYFEWWILKYVKPWSTEQIAST